MANGFNFFKKELQKHQSAGTSARAPKAPANWAIYLKQNMQDGSTNITVNLRNLDNASDDYENISVKSFEFAALTAMWTARGNASQMGFSRIDSNLSNARIYDINGVNENNTYSDLGLYTYRDLMNERRFWEQIRIFGILRAIDGQAPSKNPVIAQYFGDQPLPVIMDLTYEKQQTLMNALNVRQYDISEISGQVIRVTAQKDKNLTTKHNNRTYFLPVFTTKAMTEDQQEKMSEYADKQINELINFSKTIDAQDEMLEYIHNSGFSGKGASQVLETLFNNGVNTKAKAEAYVQDQGGWASLTNPQANVAPATPNTSAQQPQMPFNMQPTPQTSNQQPQMPFAAQTTVPNNPAPAPAATPNAPQMDPNESIWGPNAETPDSENDSMQELGDDELPF